MHYFKFLLPTIGFAFSRSTVCQAEYMAVYDYIVVGGGPSGLTVANRLSELSNISVAVVEAGGEVYNNPNVTNVEAFTVALGTAIDWQYESTNQTYAADQELEYHAGKALGGSSTINGMTYVRAENTQIDAWETIGNKGWNWNSLLPYYKKSEDFDVPTAAQIQEGASYIAAYHGESGPLKVGYPWTLTNSSLEGLAKTTWQNLGIPFNQDVNGGQIRGYTVWQSTIDRDANIREDAARAYYYPVQNRPNLHVFLNTTGNKIIWKNSIASDAVADGVEVTTANGTVYTLRARNEVVLSAGSLRSPAILELSGVGNPDILSRYDIPTKVALPSIGENLQDQINTAITYTSYNGNYTGTAPYVTYASMSDFLPKSTVTPPSNATISAWANLVSAANNNTIPASAILKLFTIQSNLLFSQQIPSAEIITTASGSTLASAFWGLIPFSRGSVHIKSSDPLVYPSINPNFGLVDFDLTLQIAICRWVRTFWKTEPVSSLVGAAGEVTPGLETVPADATDDQWAAWVKSTLTPNYHPIGTASMMSKELGGVVDANLKVYGTANVRVVDASVLPMQVSGHLTSTLYALSEKAADIIKADM